MLVKCWQAALAAAILSLTVSTVGAQSPCNGAGCGDRMQSSGYILQLNRNTGAYSVCEPVQCPPASSVCGDCCAEQKCAAAKDCCESGKCCKDGACCKSGSCCKEGAACKKCGADCSCCKENKCQCGKSEECCCGKGKECCKKAGCCGTKAKSASKTVCPFLSKLAKAPMVVVLVPPMPFFGAMHPEMSAMMPPPPPPMAAGPAVMLPHPLPPPPPMLTPPGLPVPAMTPPVMPPQTVAMPVPPPGCCPANALYSSTVQMGGNVDTCLSVLSAIGDLCCSHGSTPSLPSMCVEVVGLLADLCPAKPAAPSYVNHPPQYMPPSPPFPYPQGLPVQEAASAAVLPPPRMDGPVVVSKEVAPVPVVACAAVPCAKAAPALSVRIAAKPYSDQLEMTIDEDACLTCKKMTITLHDNPLALTRINGRIRIRGEEMKATADCIRTDRKDRLVLEGDAVLRYHKDGQPSSVIRGDRIEVNLDNGSVTVRGVSSLSTTTEQSESGSR